MCLVFLRSTRSKPGRTGRADREYGGHIWSDEQACDESGYGENDEDSCPELSRIGLIIRVGHTSQVPLPCIAAAGEVKARLRAAGVAKLPFMTREGPSAHPYRTSTTSPARTRLKGFDRKGLDIALRPAECPAI
jgi:hypothetical protein